MGISPPDSIDLGLLHALQVDGRAAFSRIADVLDISDRTVARRFGRLRTVGELEVTGLPDLRRIGQDAVRCRAIEKSG